jgi:hypothetical protein
VAAGALELRRWRMTRQVDRPHGTRLESSSPVATNAPPTPRRRGCEGSVPSAEAANALGPRFAEAQRLLTGACDAHQTRFRRPRPGSCPKHRSAAGARILHRARRNGIVRACRSPFGPENELTLRYSTHTCEVVAKLTVSADGSARAGLREQRP